MKNGYNLHGHVLSILSLVSVVERGSPVKEIGASGSTPTRPFGTQSGHRRQSCGPIHHVGLHNLSPTSRIPREQSQKYTHKAHSATSYEIRQNVPRCQRLLILS